MLFTACLAENFSPRPLWVHTCAAGFGYWESPAAHLPMHQVPQVSAHAQGFPCMCRDCDQGSLKTSLCLCVHRTPLVYGHLCMINICTGIYFHLLHVCKNHTQDRVVKWTTKHLFYIASSATQHTLLCNNDGEEHRFRWLQQLKSEIYRFYFYFSLYLYVSA